MDKTVGVIGGDRRQAELARLLTADGNTVCTYGLERWGTEGVSAWKQACAAEVVILPLPLCREEGILNCEADRISTAELFRVFRTDQIILAGQIAPQQRKEAEACGLQLEDYFNREDLIVANAAATAEGALQVAMEHLDRTLLGMNCLVVGFGRIGKLLAHRLHGLGARVTATARKTEDLAWIRAYGWPALNTGDLSGTLAKFDVIFNTVPTLVFNEGLLSQLSRGCLCVDLASVQGFDTSAAKRLNLQTTWARGLPGQLVPQTAAAAIRDTVYHILMEERGDPA